MKVKITFSALYQFEKEFGKSVAEIEDNPSISTVLELAYCGSEFDSWDKFMAEVDKMNPTELTDIVSKAVAESFQPSEAEGN